MGHSTKRGPGITRVKVLTNVKLIWHLRVNLVLVRLGTLSSSLQSFFYWICTIHMIRPSRGWRGSAGPFALPPWQYDTELVSYAVLHLCLSRVTFSINIIQI